MIYEFLKAENIKPKGWVLRQLNIQADGLHGNLDRIWPDIRESRWLGGDREGWERLPYFLDGFIPLAYLLNDKDKISRATDYVNSLLEGQEADGCFYPKGDSEKKNGDIWSVFLILKVLTVYADCSGDGRIEEAVYRCLKFLDGYIDGHPPFNWAAARWYECIIPILWLYRRRKEEWLVALARRLKVLGLDYGAAIPLWDNVKNGWSYETHVVNISMALKSDALFSEMTGDSATGLADKMLEKLFEKHGTAYGHFTGDECLSGISPSQGSELCGVVEAMYSYEWLTALTGQSKWGDLLEGLAFNALPASVSQDMWTHQYDQQVNQIACTELERSVFRTNGPQANMFGLEPHFGCCTSNFGQGWPKFVLASYMKTEEGIAVVSPIPAQVVTEQKGKRVTLTCHSEYPFRNAFTLSADSDLCVTVRIPAWAKVTCSEPYAEENGWMKLTLKAGKEASIAFAAQPVLEARPEGRACLKYGALLFALPIKGEKTMIEYSRDGVDRKFPYCDYSIVPVGEWRYAFTENPFTVEELPYRDPFDRENPPVRIKAALAPVTWEYEEGYPLVAAAKAGTERRGENELLEMQPYGATDLRITELAFVRKS